MRKIWIAGLCLASIIGCGSPAPPPVQTSKSTQVAANQPSKSKKSPKKTKETKKPKPSTTDEDKPKEDEAPPLELMPETGESKPVAEEKAKSETVTVVPSEPAPEASGKEAAAEAKATPALKVRLSADWGQIVTVDDLLSELNYCVDRMGQNLKKSGDFDKFIESLGAEGHLAAVLAALVTAHPEAGQWRAIAGEVQSQALELAEATKAKGAKNYRTAQEAHKKITELLKKGESGSKGKGNAPGGDVSDPDWAALGELGHVMKQVDRSYKRIRGAGSDESGFKKAAEDIRHAAAVLAILGEIAPAFRATEADMLQLAAPMAAGARSTIDAAQKLDFAKAQEANTALNNSCQQCHKVKRFVKKGDDFAF